MAVWLGWNGRKEPTHHPVKNQRNGSQEIHQKEPVAWCRPNSNVGGFDMSGGRACQCDEKKEPLAIPPGSNRPARLWRVIQRNCNHSAFNGYHKTYSEYSSVVCLRCGAVWRTKAHYIPYTPDAEEKDINIRPGSSEYLNVMESAGREPL